MNLFKQLGLLFVLTVLMVLFPPVFHFIFRTLDNFHELIMNLLAYVFSVGAVAIAIQKFLALIITPGIILGVIALIYWAIKRNRLPNAMAIFWVIWLLVVTVVFR